MERMAATLDDEAFAAAFSPEGLAPTQEWMTEDKWIVSYTTKRIRAGTMSGLFAVFLYQPRGKGSRSGNPARWERVKVERCDTRREARARALAFYREHSPKWSAKHPGEEGDDLGDG